MAKFNSAKDSFLVQHTDFSLREQVKYPNGGQSRFYDNGTDMVIIDEDICTHDTGEPIFSYMLITDKQNNYIQAIADSATKIKEISIEQADSMEQVEATAERIAEVVQNNTAAAQETSATSEELTAQATTLVLVSKTDDVENF